MATKSIFDTDCDKLRKKCERIRDKASIYAPEPTITIPLDLCEMLLEDHYDLKKEGA